ncbi:MAG: hypothetical protein RPR98_01815, partial [Bermanella sp.]
MLLAVPTPALMAALFSLAGGNNIFTFIAAGDGMQSSALGLFAQQPAAGIAYLAAVLVVFVALLVATSVLNQASG